MKIIPFLMVYSGLLVYQGLQSTHEFFFSLFLSPYSRQFPDLHHFLHKKIFNFNLRNVIWQVFAIIIILKCVFQLKLKKQKRKQHYYCTQVLWQVFATCVRVCKVKGNGNRITILYCLRRDKKKLVKRQWSFWFWRSAF